MRWLWLAGAVLLLVAAASVWFAFRDPDFVSGLVTAAVASLWAYLMPRLFKPASPEELARRTRLRDQGKEDTTKRPFGRDDED